MGMRDGVERRRECVAAGQGEVVHTHLRFKFLILERVVNIYFFQQTIFLTPFLEQSQAGQLVLHKPFLMFTQIVWFKNTHNTKIEVQCTNTIEPY